MPMPRKTDTERVRRNKEIPKASLPNWDGKIRGPELPIMTPEGKCWNEHTIRWYEKWRRSAQAMYTTDVDWESLFIAALIYERIIAGVSNTALAALTGELRKREDAFGGSIQSRRTIGLGDNPEAAKIEDDDNIEREVSRTVNYFERLGLK